MLSLVMEIFSASQYTTAAILSDTVDIQTIRPSFHVVKGDTYKTCHNDKMTRNFDEIHNLICGIFSLISSGCALIAQ